MAMFHTKFICYSIYIFLLHGMGNGVGRVEVSDRLRDLVEKKVMTESEEEKKEKVPWVGLLEIV